MDAHSPARSEVDAVGRPAPAWTVAGVSSLAVLVAVILVLLGGGATSSAGPGASRVVTAVEYAGWSVLAGAAGLIATRRPENRVGWFLLGSAAAGATQVLAAEYAVRGALIDPGSLPGALAVGGTDLWVWMPSYALLMLALLHFPTGELPSRGWRWTWWVAGAHGVALLVLAVAMERVDDMAVLLEDDVQLEPASPYFLLAILLLLGLVVAAAASLLVRFRDAVGVERQQLQVLAFPLALLTLLVTIETALDLGGSGIVDHPPFSYMRQIDAVLFTLSVPVALVVALLRYRLYDIGRLVRRTVTYTVVSIAMLAVYAVVATGPSLVLSADSDVLVVAATLAAAAAFRPVRRRVQDLVDRHFDRSRYDAALVAAAFTIHLRDVSPLEDLSADLASVVAATLQPASVSVWLAPRRGPRPGPRP